LQYTNVDSDHSYRHAGDMNCKRPACQIACFVSFIILNCCGCASEGYFQQNVPHSYALALNSYDLQAAPRSLPMFTSDDGKPINWQDLLNAAAWADVIIIGEQHDDSVGHAVQLAVVQDTIQRFPGTALSMEMLDREEQTLVDDYLAGIIKLDMFLEKTASTKWLRIARDYLSEEIDREKFEKRILRIGWPEWERDYQPIIDVAKENNARVIAANTPWIRYMSLASREGFDRLASLTDAQKRLFAYPKQESYPGYRERFWQVMAGRAEGEKPPEPVESEDDGEGGGVHPGLTDEQVRNTFRGQLTMDATMADSIVKALNTGSKKVVHLVGQFHSDFEGGTVQELRQRKHGIKILNISMQRAEVVALRDEDKGRADIIIYTPERIEEEEDGEAEVEEVKEVEAEEDTSEKEEDPPATQPTSQPAITKPTAKPTSQPAEQPTSQPATKPTTKPAKKKDDDD